MRVLISNDDGIEAPGIALAVQAVARITDDIWVVAPDVKRSAAGASLTMARPFIMRKCGEQRYSCSGTPADCMVTAMTWLFADKKLPDLVIAGVNDGRNVGEDLAYSGTLGVAREATFWGVPAIGFSRMKNPDLQDSDAEWLANLISQLWQARQEWTVEGHWLSINLPQSLPATLCQPKIGRDKIARTTEILREDGDVVELIIPRGRASDTVEGDENDMISRGFATINRLNWFGESRLTESFLENIDTAI